MLNTFQLHEKLGEGADSEVFAATDTETGMPVVVKRPHPTLITRGQHKAVELRMKKVIALRERLGDRLPHLAGMLAYTGPSSHDGYFDDALGAEYSVVVEERARGIPLVGSAVDGIKSHPVGAPQSLFAVHPIVPHSKRGRFSIVCDILKVAEAFDSAGTLILDMRPQNIYFAPATASVTVIDIGGVTEPRPASGGKPPLDLHDFYLELFKWYIPHSAPPSTADGYRQPTGMETIPIFNQNLDTMIRQHSEAADEPCKSAALDILHRVKERVYPSIQAFKSDFEAYLSLLDEKYERLSRCESVRQAWTDALCLLTADYWRKFQFHPRDLAHYSVDPTSP